MTFSHKHRFLLPLIKSKNQTNPISCDCVKDNHCLCCQTEENLIKNQTLSFSRTVFDPDIASKVDHKRFDDDMQLKTSFGAKPTWIPQHMSLSWTIWAFKTSKSTQSGVHVLFKSSKGIIQHNHRKISQRNLR